MPTNQDGRDAAKGVTWDLSDLYAGPDDPKIDRDLDEAEKLAELFAQRYRGSLTAAITAGELAEAMQALEGLLDLAYRPVCYAQLVFSGDTSDPKTGALMQRVQERMTQVTNHLIFFDLEWVELDDEVAEKLVSEPALERYRHYLRTVRKYKPHKLTEREERLINELDNTGSSAFQRLFDEIMGGMRCRVKLPSGDEAELSEEETLALLHDGDRGKRKAGADAMTASLVANKRILSFIFNNLVQDHSVHDRIRSYKGPMQSRNLANEIPGETVEALLAACDRHSEMVGRFYRAKAKLLGIDEFYDYDRYAPLDVGDAAVIPFQDARDIVLGAYADFSPDMSTIAKKFFDCNWIDAEVREGKRGGAFSHGMVPSTHPYVFANYTGGRRDVMTIAHELGHGVHQWLARSQGLFHADTPLTMAETASVFGEMLVFQRLLRDTPDDKAKLALLVGKIEDSFATVFRQASMTRFEQSVHKERRTKGELTTERLNELWLEANERMFHGSVTLREDYGYWWMYIPHFVHTPFYCYAYSFGELLVLALYKKYETEGDAFVPKYLELLRSGGNDAPEALLAKIGVDINHPAFWDGGMEVLRQMVDEVERLA